MTLNYMTAASATILTLKNAWDQAGEPAAVHSPPTIFESVFVWTYPFLVVLKGNQQENNLPTILWVLLFWVKILSYFIKMGVSISPALSFLNTFWPI